MQQMTWQQMRSEREKMEDDIGRMVAHRVRDFELATGLEVDSVTVDIAELRFETMAGQRSRFIEVKARARIYL